MFRTGSPYSPFFTSGFLSEPTTYSPRSSYHEHLGPRRGSLPTDISRNCSLSGDQSSAFYFTLQPKRDQFEHRSFLSLDLAESQSLRSASLKRRGSCLPKPSVRSSKPEQVPLSLIPEVPKGLAPPTSLRIRRSRDSLRTIPSPKPAPSTTLPDLPRNHPLPSPIASTPPRLPSIVVSPSLGLNLECGSRSMPSLHAREPPKRLSTVSVSTHVRKVNRSDALARLEGRSKSADHNSPSKHNFMSMSDDEDDSDLDTPSLCDQTLVPLNTDLEPEDLVLPTVVSPIRLQSAKSAPIGGRFPKSKSSPSSSPRTARRGKLCLHQKPKEWFPLKSFIDLHNDDEISAWSWRSFIEVVSVS